MPSVGGLSLCKALSLSLSGYPALTHLRILSHRLQNRLSLSYSLIRPIALCYRKPIAE